MPSYPASQIPARIEGLSGPFSLRSVTGAPIRLIEREELDIYVEAAVVSGNWNRQKVKYFQFTAPEAEVNHVLGQCARNVRGTRARTPLDLLIRMAAARKSTFLDRFEVIRGGKTVMAAVFQHKGMQLERQTA